MRIECPSCTAEYEVPAARVGSRRVVRCSRCGVEWTAEREHDANEATFGPQPEPDPPRPAPVIDAADRPPVPASPPARRWGLIAAWIASVVLLAGIASACLFWRARLTALWPPSERLLGTAAPAPANSPNLAHVANESGRMPAAAR